MKRAGKVIVHDESISEFFGMPKSAIDVGQVDLILPLEKIAPAIVACPGGGDPRAFILLRKRPMAGCNRALRVERKW